MNGSFPRRAPVLAIIVLFTCLEPLGAAREEPIAPEVAALHNVVENPGFEEGDTQPAWWHRHPAEDAGRNRLLVLDVELCE